MGVRVEVNVPTEDNIAGENLPLYMGSGHGFVQGELVEEAERLVLRRVRGRVSVASLNSAAR